MQIKETPEDFIVEERIRLNTKSKGDYTYFLLEKRNWTTLKAIEFISNYLKVPVKRFSFAGQKDRRGITKQHVSAFHISESMLNKIELKDIKIKFLGYGDRPLSLGSLIGNKFQIKYPTKKKIDFIVNYYDEQRFGGYRPNLHLIGKNVLLKKYEEAVKLFLLYPFENETKDYKDARKRQEKNWGKWHVDRYPKYLLNERKIIGYLSKHPDDYQGALHSLPKQLFDMMTQSFQSYIWNESLSRYLKSKFKNHREAPYSVGKLVFVDEYLNLKWPIVGNDSKLTGDVKKFVEEVLNEQGVWYNNFQKSLERDAMTKVKDYKINGDWISFFLPKSSYATMLIKNLEN
ncbi:tRNA pseudouridine(13) synthase TruD [Candidatus Woesearchaeota archaeon]|nr:tRNA pseudouridine(13) synthase TruD [Candidatus Woesearchaeota archaeon]